MFYFLLMVLTSASLLTACSKENLKNRNLSDKLIFSVGGISIEKAIAFKDNPKSILGNSFRSEIQSENSTSRSYDVGEFTMDVSGALEPLSSLEGEPGMLYRNSQSKIASTNARTALVPMLNGIKYRILLVNPISNSIEYSGLATSGELLEIDVVKGADYKWIAYSYNTEDVIEEPQHSQMTIDSRTDAPLLYASGMVRSAVVGSEPIVINFQHQLAQVQVEIDTKGLFGGVEELDAMFAGDYIKVGKFNILNGTFDPNMISVDVGNLLFHNPDSTSNRVKLAKYYTADTQISSFRLQFSNLSIRLINDKVESLSAKFPSGGLLEFGPYAGSSKGKIIKGLLEMWKIFPKKRILHVEGNAAYSYAASNPLKASGAFLRNPLNFGLKSEFLRIEGFEHEVVGSARNTLKNRLADPANYPDIIIAGMFSGFLTDDYNAMAEYINRGGVVFLMIENSNQYVDAFMKNILGPSVSTANYDSGGAIYTLTTEDADVLNWRFGDVRGKNWGQDFSATLYVKDIPEGLVIPYTSDSRNYAPRVGTTMFRHKTKHLFFVGDTGFLSCELRSGQYPGYLLEPFVVSTDGKDLPLPHKAYGNTTALGALDYYKVGATYEAHNSMIFGNVFSLLVATSHYNGINKVK
ncbi:hypothetical protein [Sphingobacterium sp. BN32]|uniref:hypothetical protein n=1 Tax=Sphingobacterium sp. BN32 TaxID=3058432 RepID=UPI00265CADC6|nr:hypothetical protein [Sphingobacterium sp. BN32]WKK59508.1 hypothetical protein QYC40_04575 [Sphingobacterium sp. BN32]